MYGNYPTMSQSEWDNAPWNEEPDEEKEVEVTISVTYSKTCTVKINEPCNEYAVRAAAKDDFEVVIE